MQTSNSEELDHDTEILPHLLKYDRPRFVSLRCLNVFVFVLVINKGTRDRLTDTKLCNATIDSIYTNLEYLETTLHAERYLTAYQSVLPHQ